jgi:outer membrane protein
VKKLLFPFLLLTAAVISTHGKAEETRTKNKWEFGLGLGGLSIPHYRGSDQRDEYVAPVPYVKFHGNRLKVDREGGRYFFYNGEEIKVDLSAAFAFPVDSEENRARQGMPDLDAILEVGPRLQWFMWESDDQRLRLRLGAPIRLAINLSDAGNEGWFFSPYFQVRYYSNMETALSIGPMWASEKFHDYYYQVDSQYATPTRPAYNATSGYSGFRITLTNSQRISKHYWWGGFLRYDSLSGAVFEDSPLVKQNSAFMAGLAISYIFNPVKEYYTDPYEQ